MDPQQASAWLSGPRFEPFLAATQNHHDLAVELYDWHAEIVAACFGLIHHFEVLVRNSIDGVLGEGQPQEPLKDTWLMDFDVLQPNGIKQVFVAVERLEKGKGIRRSRVVAGVSFGFWAGLFSKSYEELWRHRLRHAFPHGSIMRKDLIQPMRSIQSFRNRVAHHDCLLGQNIEMRADDMFRIGGWIDPDARAWLEAHSRVHSLLDQKPSLPSS
jgi:hypothetical protein